jgi:chromatin assembly factor 1 subunit B
VQGVAFDPQGVYLASMSSDRTVRIHPRKVPGKKKKKVLRTIGNASSSGSNNNNNNIPPLAHQAMVEALLTDSKLEMCTKSKQIKYRKLTVNQEAAADAQEAGPKPARQALFADESTLQSFVRRLAWTPDGAFLVTPAVMWQTTPESPPQFATCMWGRHNWDEPARVLLGMEKVSVYFLSWMIALESVILSRLKDRMY